MNDQHADLWLSTGELPQDHLSAIKYEVRQLLAETDRGRQQPTLPIVSGPGTGHAIAAATTLSAACRFTGTSPPRCGLASMRRTCP